MRWVGIFMAVSALALIIIFYNSRPFDPGVNLPELDAGKPFTKWHGIVVTCTVDGEILLDGKSVARDAVEEVKQLLTARKADFAELRNKLPPEYRRSRTSFVPILLCMDKDATLDRFFQSIDVLYRANCINIYFAGRKKDESYVLSLCSCAAIGWGFYFWHEESFNLEGRLLEVKARISMEGKFSIFSWFPPMIHGKPIIELDEEVIINKDTGKPLKPKYPHDNVEPMFEMIEKYKGNNVIVNLDLNRYSKNLTWGWLVKLLARLEKTDIKGYAFATPD